MIGFFPKPEPWMEDAACTRVDNDLFFPEKGTPTKDAKKVCFGCISREACLQYALERGERFGVWGGKSERERASIRRSAGMAA
jgi:WhiB family redox-sensing transcriptional regulator